MSGHQNNNQYYPKPGNTGSGMPYHQDGGQMGGYYNHRGGDKSRNMHIMQQPGQGYMNEAVPPKYMAEMNPKKSSNQDSYNTFSGGGKNNGDGGKKSGGFNHRSGTNNMTNSFYPGAPPTNNSGPMPGFNNPYAPVPVPKSSSKNAQATQPSPSLQKSGVPQPGMGFPNFPMPNPGPSYGGSYPEQFFALDEKQSAKASEKARGAPTENSSELNTELGSSNLQQSGMNKKYDKDKAYFNAGRRNDGNGTGRFEHSSKKDKYPKQKKRRNDQTQYEEYESPENEEPSNFDSYNKPGNNSSSNNGKRYNDKGDKKDFKRDEKTAELDTKRAAVAQFLKGVETYSYDVSESVRLAHAALDLQQVLLQQTAQLRVRAALRTRRS